jgi:16S rRNA (cytosine967-C5)-methyltransferase
MSPRPGRSETGAPTPTHPDDDVELTRPQVEAAMAAVATLLPMERPADVVLRAWFRDHPMLGVRDRGVVADTAFAVLRHLRRLEHLAGSRAARPLVLCALMFVAGRPVRSLQPHLRGDEGAWLASLR